MQVGAAAAGDGKIRDVKKIQLAGEGRIPPARAFGHGGDSPPFRREPMHDEAGLGEQPRAQNQAGAGFNHVPILLMLVRILILAVDSCPGGR